MPRRKARLNTEFVSEIIDDHHFGHRHHIRFLFFRKRDAFLTNEFAVESAPFGHGVKQRAIHIKDSRFHLFKHNFTFSLQILYKIPFHYICVFLPCQDVKRDGGFRL